MTSVYNSLRETCGVSQSEAADYVHEVRLDTVKSWCSDRRPAPEGAIAELQELARDIQRAGDDYAAQLKRSGKDNVYTVGLPHDEQDARLCGFPSIGAQMRAISIAISRLPANSEIRMVERRRDVPTAALQKGTLKMREVPDPAANDLPDPAPGGFQNSVNSRPRTPAEISRKLEQKIPVPDPAPFHAVNGARFEATIQKTPDGPQASFGLYLDVPGGTRTATDVQLFTNEEEAMNWLDRHARARGFVKYPLERRK